MAVRADVGRLPFATGSVDAIHAGAAIHCWPNPQAAMAEISRVLKPGGIFVASTFLTPFAPLGEIVGDSTIRPISQVSDIHTCVVVVCVGVGGWVVALFLLVFFPQSCSRCQVGCWVAVSSEGVELWGAQAHYVWVCARYSASSQQSAYQQSAETVFASSSPPLLCSTPPWCHHHHHITT